MLQRTLTLLYTIVQTGAYGDKGRDPRGWTVTVAFAAVVPSRNLGVRAADDAKEAAWWEVGHLPTLAFDHKRIVREAFQKLAQERKFRGDLLSDKGEKALLEAAGTLAEEAPRP
jgi:ADP-ribose pyrophosphatase YjhB (NUDIX family)